MNQPAGRQSLRRRAQTHEFQEPNAPLMKLLRKSTHSSQARQPTQSDGNPGLLPATVEPKAPPVILGLRAFSENHPTRELGESGEEGEETQSEGLRRDWKTKAAGRRGGNHDGNQREIIREFKRKWNPPPLPICRPSSLPRQTISSRRIGSDGLAPLQRVGPTPRLRRSKL